MVQNLFDNDGVFDTGDDPQVVKKILDHLRDKAEIPTHTLLPEGRAGQQRGVYQENNGWILGTGVGFQGTLRAIGRRWVLSLAANY